METTNKTKYVGGWVAGKKDGYGTLELEDGSKYGGFFKQGKRDGVGTEQRENGELVFRGEFRVD